MLVRFNETLFLKQSRWFVWDTSIGGFRPVDGYDFNGKKFVMNDEVYCADPTDAHYAYGSPEMENVCEKLSAHYEPYLSKATDVPFLDMGNLVWYHDRPMSLTPDVDTTDIQLWKNLVKGKPKTRRSHPRKTFTKRALARMK